MKPPSTRTMRLAIAGCIALVLATGFSFYSLSRKHKQQIIDEVITVTINGKSCDPHMLSVPAGRHTFKIINNSDRTVEWEILDGVMVVEERENIAPGFSSMLTAKLEVGDYQITCGLLSNPRGTLKVTPSENSEKDASQPPVIAFIGPLAEYQVYLSLEAASLTSVASHLLDAIRKGNLEQARTLYLSARTLYSHVEPVAQRFVDLDAAISPRVDYLEEREADPKFKGFHKLEYALFSQKNLANLEPVANELLANIAALQQNFSRLQLPPSRMSEGVHTLLTRWIGSLSGKGEERYSDADLKLIIAILAGSGKVIDLLNPLVSKADPRLARGMKAQLTEAIISVESFKKGEDYPPFSSLSQRQRDDIIKSLQRLADKIIQLNASIGLE